ncbi:hypothetical protein [Aeromicrobium yanjiei]|uniref:Uncharacterized protein n=1 Tax=Aeromicrobium yanjiei TaxID=2662028 RepID=A0A5Q2MQM7_9ACTN|nr:hypothetical protein [Aeromicrobium yanjiei]QGG42650.1 hypothetical protein GEV26_15395 [Aeromicrobium yanjiei]
MFLMLYTLIALALSALVTTALVILIGDLMERRRDPRRGLPTYRRIRRDTHTALDLCRRALRRDRAGTPDD